MSLERLSFALPALRGAYAGGLRPRAVIAEAFRRIAAAADPGVFIHLRDGRHVCDEADALGAHATAAGPLWGAPYVVKDNIDVAGAPTTAACPEFAYDPPADAFAVAQLRAAGAICLGKTNLDQFATGLVGLRTPYPVPRNALDPEIVPGGSSSGSAVAVARGLASFALGSDTAGSGRAPAALNGIVGLKPSLGTVSARGLAPACRSLDTISVFSAAVSDAVAVYKTIAVFDPRDPYARAARAPVGLEAIPPSLRIGAPDAATRIFDGDTAQKNAFERDLAALKSALSPGVGDMVEVDFSPFFDVARLLYDGPWVAERYAAIRPLIESRPHVLHPITRRIIGAATRFSAADAFEGGYRLAALKRAIEPVWRRVDLLATPSIPRFVTCAEAQADPIGPNSLLGTYTNFVNLLDLAAITAPTPAREDGRPGSLTLIGPWGSDNRLASIAARLIGEATPGAGSV